MKHIFLWLVMAGVGCGICLGQAVGAKVASGGFRPDDAYVLGPGDQIEIRAAHAEELGSVPYRVDGRGEVDLPLLGKMHPGGKTLDAFQAEVFAALSELIRDPQVNVSITQFRSETVTFTGSFKTPGVYSLQGLHTLTEMLAVTGGLQSGASRVLTIRRAPGKGSIPLLTASENAPGGGWTAQIDVSSGKSGRSNGDEFILQPGDVVTAIPGEPIYVTGEVARVGTVELEDRRSMNVIQVLALSGGLGKEASTHIKIYRPAEDSKDKTEIDVNLEKVVKGEASNPELRPRDVVFVPRASGKVMASRLATVAIGIAAAAGAGLAITH